MSDVDLPQSYVALLNLRDTEIAIKMLKDYFEINLARELGLTRVSAPLFLYPDDDLNDNLNTVSQAVTFDIKETGKTVQVVHSLFKWKRVALKEYGFKNDEGLYTNMNAIRKYEITDNMHSIYVDQWDWEKIISKEDRNLSKLREVVKKIYKVFKMSEKYVTQNFQNLNVQLPEDIYFITVQELEELYPDKTPKEREQIITKKKGAVFIMKTGSVLKSGMRHDDCVPDYDDWELNGSILFYYQLLDTAMGISNVGIRVGIESLKKQLEVSGCPERLTLPHNRDLVQGKLPCTMGGGIGQSRLCMFLLQKAHIGEVQSSVWPPETIQLCAEAGIKLL